MQRTILTALTALSVGLTASAGHAAAIAPNDPSLAADLQLWLTADAGVTQSGGVVTTWADQSGNGRNVTSSGSNAPKLVYSAGLQYQPVLRFDGSNDYLVGVAGTTAIDFFGSTPSAGTVLVVFSPRNDDNERGAEYIVQFPRDAANASFLTLINDGYLSGSSSTNNADDAGVFARTASGFATLRDENALAQNDGFLAAYGFDNSLSTVFMQINDRAVKTTSAAVTYTSTPDEPIQIARSGGDSLYYGGDIAQVIVYDRTLTAAELAGLQHYLTSQYLVPEPATLVMLVGGLLALVGLSRLRRRGR